MRAHANDRDTRADRIIYMDWLRAIAAFCVVATHAAQPVWQITDISSSAWRVANIYESAVRWSVPVFVMISGALMLKSRKSFRSIFQHNIVRQSITLFIWGVLYFAESVLYYKKGLSESVLVVLYSPLWFLFMLIGLYAIIPFLRLIVEEKRRTEYFLLLSIAFQIVFPFALRWLDRIIPQAAYDFDVLLDDIHFKFGMGFSLYFVLGYYLNTYQISRRTELLICIVGLAAFFVLPYEARKESIAAGRIVSQYDNLTLGIMLESAFVFVVAKKLFTKNVPAVIQSAAACSLGVYLLQKIVFDVLGELRLNYQFVNPILSIPLISLGIFVFCWMLTQGFYFLMEKGKAALHKAENR